MQIVTLATFLAVLSVAQAAVFSWMTVPMVLLSMNKQAEGFFSLFRRRPSPIKSAPLPKEIPEGPVRPSMPNFPPQGFHSFNPFGSGFQNMPSFSGGFQANRFAQQQPARQPWFPQGSFPQQNSPQPGKQSIPPDFHTQSMNFQQDQSFESEQSFGQNIEESDPSFGMDGDRDMRFDDSPPPINMEEAESFFTLLAETDENKCISRLVCELGADPSNAGDLGQTVTEIIGTLTDFPPGSKVSEYNEILIKGRSQGLQSCVSKYPTCDEETYVVMKSNQPDESELAEGASLLSEDS